MKISSLSLCSRYAQAVYDCHGRDIFSDVSAILEVYDSDVDFRSVFDSKAKSSVAAELIGCVCEELLVLMRILIKFDRFLLFIPICRLFVKLSEHESGILNIEVFSALPLSSDVVEDISAKIKSYYSVNEVFSENIVNTALLGGVQIKVGNKLFDFSLRSKLNNIRRLFKDSLMEV